MDTENCIVIFVENILEKIIILKVVMVVQPDILQQNPHVHPAAGGKKPVTYAEQ